MTISPEQYDTILNVCLVLTVLGAVLLLVGRLGPKLIAAWRFVDETNVVPDPPKVPSDPDLMAVAREVDGREYRP